MKEKFQISTPVRILTLFVLVNLIVAVFIVPDYGRSTDEKLELIRSTAALQIYTGDAEQGFHDIYEDMGAVRYYGTAGSVLIRLVERVFFPNMDHSTLVVAHYFYFVFFQGAVVGIFLLGRFFYSEWVSLAVALLFGTQPLLFGHAFINPKDIPLMTMFMFAIVTGFWMVDSWQKRGASPPGNVAEDPAHQKKQWGFLGVVVGVFLILWFSNPLFDLWVAFVEYSHASGGWFPGSTLEEALKATSENFYRARLFGVVIIPLMFVVLFWGAQKRKLFAGRINLVLLLAAAAWGFVLSIRVVAFTAGGIVGLYALFKAKKRAVLLLLIYILTAGVFSYLSWPYLWDAGIQGALEALVKFSSFDHTRVLLFEGQLYTADTLPLYYLPKLMLLQFTIPVEILILVGFLIGLYWVSRKKVDQSKFWLLFAWFILPLMFGMFVQASHYGNFRQYLFALPPLFVFAGIAIQQAVELLKRPVWIVLAVVLMVGSGVVNIVHLHPYQYVYYNEFAGGVAGAYEEYELDYWLTAYKDMMAYVNINLPRRTKILVMGDDIRARVYLNKDIDIETYKAVLEADYDTYDYVLISRSALLASPQYADYPVVYSVDVDDVSLMVLATFP